MGKHHQPQFPPESCDDEGIEDKCSDEENRNRCSDEEDDEDIEDRCSNEEDEEDQNRCSNECQEEPPECRKGTQDFCVSGKCHNTINDVLKKAKKMCPNSNIRIFLKSCVNHQLNESFDLDLNNIEIFGDFTQTVGVFYGHDTAADNASTLYREVQPDVGTGPYQLEVCGNRITVHSSNGYCDPDFKHTRGRIVKVFQPNSMGGHFDCFKIMRSCNNSIYLDKDVCLDCGVERGVGFYIQPNVCFNTGDQNKLLGGVRLSYRGINFTMGDGDNGCQKLGFITGATSGFLGFNNNVINSPITITSSVNSKNPNTNISRTTFKNSGGNLFRFSTLGKRGTTIAMHCFNLSFHSSSWIGCDTGHQIQQGSTTQSLSCFHYKCQTAVSAVASSIHGTSGSFYGCNNVGIDHVATSETAQADTVLSDAYDKLIACNNGVSAQFAKNSTIYFDKLLDTNSGITVRLIGSTSFFFNQAQIITGPGHITAAQYVDPNNGSEHPIGALGTGPVYYSLPAQNGVVDPANSYPTNTAYNKLVIT